MRLIDADAFKEAIGTDTKIREVLCEIVDTRPTVFDLEKVVAEIEKESVVSEGYFMNFTEEVIDIVRKAVLNE
jgi:hypothetical protein